MVAKISVIVTNYNHGRLISNALQSIAQQSLQPYEIITVDDGSDLPSTQPVRISSATHVVAIQQPHLGIGAALNAGIRQMTGDVFTWLPADDLWKPEKLEKQFAFAIEHPGCILHSYCEVWNNGTFARVGMVPNLNDAAFAGKIRSSSPYYANTFWIPKPILDLVGSFREDVPASEDYEWVLRSVVNHGVRYRLQAEVLTVKRHHPGQTTVRYRDQIPGLVRQFNEEIDQCKK